MKALVFVDCYDGVLDQDALGVLSKAAGLGGEVTALVCGLGVGALATEAAPPAPTDQEHDAGSDRLRGARAREGSK